MQRPYPYFQQPQEQFGGPASGSLRRRRGPPGPPPQAYQDYNSNYGQYSEYEPEEFEEPVKKRVGLVLPPNHKRIALSCLSRRKARNKWETIDEMPVRRKPKRYPLQALPNDYSEYSGYAAMERQPLFQEQYQQPPPAQYYPDQTPVEIGEDDEEEEEEESDSIFPKLTGQQRMKVGLALLMIPSLIVLMSSQKKFKSESNSNIDLAALKSGGYGGIGGMGGAGGAGGAGALGHHPGLPGMGATHGQGGGHSPYPPGIPGLDKYRSHQPRTRKNRNRRRRPPIPGLPPELGLHDPESAYDGDPGDSEETEENEDGRDYDPDYRHPEGMGPRHWRDRDEYRGEPYPDEPEEGPPEDAKEDTKTEPSSNANSMEVTLEPEKAAVEDDYEEGIPLSFHGLDNYMMHEQRRRRATAKPKGNPDPQLAVEAETLDPALLQGITDPPTLSDLEAPLVQLKESGFKIIVDWSGQDQGELQSSGVRPFTNAECPVSRCALTNDRSLISHGDAVVIAAGEKSLPSQRLTTQRWIYRQDAPYDALMVEDHFRGVPFNWTWSHRRDSDIISSRGYFEYKPKAASAKAELNLVSSRTFQVWRNKRRMIMLWQDTNCETPIPFIEALKGVIDVDVFGKCGKSICTKAPVMQIDDEIARDDSCFKSAAKDYLFMMPVESNNCTDLLTHKVLQALDANIIPVALSASNYSALSPPKSIIRGDQFKSAKDLADFLNDVGTDFNKYKEYFDWKRRYGIVYKKKDLCKLCTLLHQLQFTTAVAKYADIQEWINKDQCPLRTFNSTST